MINLNHRHLNDLYRVMGTKFPGFRSMLTSGRLLDQKVLENQGIHFAFGESIESIGWGVYDGFTLQVEGRVQYDWNAGGLPKTLDQAIIARALLEKNSL